MPNNDLAKALGTYNDQISSETAYVPFNPAFEVQSSLVSLLKHRINKIQDDLSFEVRIKEEILTRIDEANFSELLQTLNTIQTNTNVSVEKILAPFISKNEHMLVSIQAIEEARMQKVEGNITSNANAEELKALQELTRIITYSNRISETPILKSNPVPEDGGSITDTGEDD